MDTHFRRCNYQQAAPRRGPVWTCSEQGRGWVRGDETGRVRPVMQAGEPRLKEEQGQRSLGGLQQGHDRTSPEGECDDPLAGGHRAERCRHKDRADRLRFGRRRRGKRGSRGGPRSPGSAGSPRLLLPGPKMLPELQPLITPDKDGGPAGEASRSSPWSSLSC